MKKQILIMTGLVAMLLTSCYKSDIDDLKSQVNDLKGQTGEIASIQTQITGINTTIATLQTTSSNLQSYVTELQNNEKATKQQISSLQAADQQLTTGISDLKQYVDNELKNATDWTAATFATLAQLDSLSDVVAALPAKIDAVSKALGEAKTELTKNYEKAIKEAVELSEQSMQQWVNEKLTGYCTIAHMNASIDSLGLACAASDSTLAAGIEEQKDSLASAKTELTAAYQAAIKKAIEEEAGRIDGKVAQDIAAAQDALQTQITAINNELAPIKERLAKIESDIDALLKQVQSIVVVPDYTDGSTKVIGRTATFSFDIMPVETAVALAEAWQSAEAKEQGGMVYLNLKDVKSKGQTSQITDSIKNVYVEKGEFKIDVLFSSAPENVMASLNIAMGKSNVASNYFPTYVVPMQEVLDETYKVVGRLFANGSAGSESPLLSLWEYASDDVYVAGSSKNDCVAANEVQSFRATSRNSLIANTYRAYNDVIDKMNELIFNYQDYIDAADENALKCHAEIRVLRAYAHYLLALGWGNVPVIDHLLAKGEDPIQPCSREEVLTWCTKEYQEAMERLWEKENAGNYERSFIVTKQFAGALLGKCYLNLGVFSEAFKWFDNVIQSGKYALESSIEDIDVGAEPLFKLQYEAPTQENDFLYLWNWRSSRMYMPDEAASYGQGACNPSKKFVDAILVDERKLDVRRGWIKSYDEVLAMSYPSADKGIKRREGVYGNVGYFIWKGVSKAQNVGTSREFTVMRFAEVLLLAAECGVQVGDITKAAQYLNKVRERAGLTALTSATMDAVREEKFIETWLEGTRFQDLVRWGKASDELAKNGHYYPTFKDKKVTQHAASHEGYVDESDAAWCVKRYPGCGFKTGKSELFPFPDYALRENPLLVQNPGY